MVQLVHTWAEAIRVGTPRADRRAVLAVANAVDHVAADADAAGVGARAAGVGDARAAGVGALAGDAGVAWLLEP